MPKSELKSKTFHSGDDRLYTHAVARLVASGEIEEFDGLVRRRGFAPHLSSDEATLREQLADALLRGRFSPPSLEDLGKVLKTSQTTFSRVVQTLLDDGTAVEVGAGIIFHRDVLEEIKHVVATEIKEKKNVTVASLRDRLGTSRKYALTVLEYLDRIRMTRRVGDHRVLISR